MQTAISAFNREVGGRLIATSARAFVDRRVGGNAFRLTLEGYRSSGEPFSYTSPPVSPGGGDITEVAVSLARTALAYQAVAAAVAPIVREVRMAGEIASRMRAYKESRQKLITRLETALTEGLLVHTDGHDVVGLLEADTKTVQAEVREMRADLASATNGGPPLARGDDASPKTES